MTDCIIEHPSLGTLIVKVNPRAKRFIFRPGDDGGLIITAPLHSTSKELDKSIQKLLPRLQKMLQRHEVKQEQHFIGPDFVIDTPDFKMSIRQGIVHRPSARLIGDTLQVIYPEGMDFAQKSFQDWLVMIAEEALRHIAKRILPQRLAVLAARYGFKFNEVKINKSRGRWGSCNSKGNINLSLYLVLLPDYLRDSVLLHELCHTREMNHSPRFWEELNKVTDGKALALREEMKQYDTNIFIGGLR